MKKVLIISLSAVAALLLVCVVLFFVFFGQSSKHYSAIPDGSVFLVKVNAGNIIKESEALEQPVVETALDMLVKSMPRDARELMEEIVKDPSASGIDVDCPAVFALVDTKPMKGVFVMAVKDKARLEEVVGLFADEFNEMELEENDGVTYIGFGNRNRSRNKVSIAYDADKFVVAMADKYADAEEYFGLDSEEQALNNKAYSRFFGQDDDAAMYIDAAAFTGNTGTYLSRSEKQMLKFMGDMTIFMSLNFENGYAELLTAVEPSDEYREIVENSWVDVTHRHFKYIPSGAIAVACIGIDSEKLVDMESLKSFVSNLKKMGFTGNMLESMYGDLTFAVLPVEKLGKDNVPQFMLVADCSDRSLFDQAVKIMKEEKGVTSVGEDVYALGLNKYREYNNYYWNDYSYTEKRGGYDYYFMYKDDAIFVLPENVYRDLADGEDIVELEESIAGNDTFNSFEGAGATCDFGAIVTAVTEVAGRMSSSDRKVIDFMELFKSVDVVADTPFEVKARVNLVNQNENVLKVLVDEIVSMFSKEIMRNL